MIEKITISKDLFDNMVTAVKLFREETNNTFMYKIMCEIEETALCPSWACELKKVDAKGVVNYFFLSF